MRVLVIYWSKSGNTEQMLSADQYREFVLPYHKRLADELACGKIASMHLCGDATRHFPLIEEELGCLSFFDTGFRMDLSWLRQTLGEKAFIHGGVHVGILEDGPPERIRKETRGRCEVESSGEVVS